MTKKIYLMLLSIFLSVTYLSAQVVQTVNIPTAGGLSTAIGSNLKTVTDLTLTGTINAADFNTIKQMTALKRLDMSKVAVVDNTIPAGAFQGRVLNSLQLPSTITNIGDGSFSGAQISALDLTLMPNLEKIGVAAFADMTIPILDFSKSTKLNSVGFNAFAGTKTDNMVLDFSNSPNLSAGENYYELWGTFSNYSGHVILPRTMTHLFNNAFGEFTGTVDLPEGLVSIGDCAFKGSKPSKPLVLPSTIRSIGRDAFLGMKSSSLDLTLMPNLEKIGVAAFAYMTIPILDFSKSTKLNSVGFNAFAGTKTDNMVLDFSNSPNLSAGENYYGVYGAFSLFSGHVILHRTMTHLFDNAFSSFLGTVDLPQGLQSIGNNAFAKSKPAKPLILPSTVTNIGNSAFSEMQSSSLDLTQIPNLEKIESYAFNGIVVPELDFSKSTKLKRINFNAFVAAKLDKMVLDFSNSPNLSGGENYYGVYGAFSLFSGHVILHRTMTHLFDNAFSSFLGTVDLPQGLQSIGNNAFAKSKPAKPLILPSTVTNIGNSAFSEMQSSSLDLTQIPNLEKIESYAFNGIVVPELDFSKSTKLKRINFNAFVAAKLDKMVLDFSNSPNLSGGENYYGVYGAFSLFSGHVILPRTMTLLFDNAFANFKGTVDLPKGLVSIGNNVFQSSTITSIELPASVTSIGTNAFNGASQLSKIISNNPTPPTLGANVFLGVNKETTTLEVPKESLTLYGSAAQWKDFLNIKVTIPKELDVKYSYNGVDFWDYHAIRIGEYYWFDENFYHYALKEQWSGERGDEINYPMTQARLNKYMPFVYLDSLDYQVNIDDFNRSYGLHHHWYSARDLEAYGSIYNSGKKEKGWGLPTAGDAEQLFAMAPSFQEPYVNYQTVTYGLGAHLGDNPMAFDIAPKTPGSPYKTDWFTLATRYTSPEEDLGFKLMPNGAKLNADNDTWKNGLLDPFTGDSSHIGNKGDIYHLFYASGFWLKNQGYAYIHDHLAIVTVPQSTFHWMGIRYTRRLTDEELGYKLYKNDSKEDIVKLGLSDTPPAGYTELEPGYLRGYYVKYIINKPTSGMTPKDLYYKLKHYTNVELPQPKTRTIESDEVIVPFKTDASVTLYPNPVQDVLNISGEGVERVTIYDMSGRQVSTAKNVNTISVSNLSKGTYLVRVLTANGESTHKVIKK